MKSTIFKNYRFWIAISCIAFLLTRSAQSQPNPVMTAISERLTLSGAILAGFFFICLVSLAIHVFTSENAGNQSQSKL